MCLLTGDIGIKLLIFVAHADKSYLKICMIELAGIAGSCWREEQGQASDGGQYFAHLTGFIVAQTENKYKLSFCLGYID